MSFQKVKISFMSGTGNSYRVANWIGENAARKNQEAKVFSIESAWNERKADSSPQILFGLVFPTHGFTSPWHMIRYAWRMPGTKTASAFVIATRAGTKFGRVFLPGIAGSAAFLIAIILVLKGYRLRGATAVDMPSNWTALHPGYSEQSARAIMDRTKPKVDRFADRILAGSSQWISWSNLWDFLWMIPLSWISGMYLIAGRFYLAKMFFANERCNGCGLCALSCPVQAIRMRGKSAPRPFWRYNCESCMRCMSFCPEQAVEAGHSWAAILFWITSIPVAAYLLAGLTSLLPTASFIDTDNVRGVINFLYIYPAMFLAYYVFHFLNRFRIINKLFSYTTLTRWYRRYHEPDTKLKDFVEMKKFDSAQK